MAGPTIGIVGGTGAEGSGLAKRFAAAGHSIIIGSRQADKAVAAATALNDEIPGGLASGAHNGDAARRADIVVLTIPFDAMDDTLSPLAEALDGKIVISTIVPMTFAGGTPSLARVAEGSAAQRAQALAPNCRVVGGFHHLSARTLANVPESLDSDILVCGDDQEAKAIVLALAAELPGARGIDAGGLDGSGVVEGFTVALLRINRRYRVHAGVRVTHLP